MTSAFTLTPSAAAADYRAPLALEPPKPHHWLYRRNKVVMAGVDRSGADIGERADTGVVDRCGKRIVSGLSGRGSG